MTSFNVVSEMAMVPDRECRTPTLIVSSANAPEIAVEDMAAAWSPDLFHDEFKEKLQQLVQAKAAAGDVATLQPLPGEEAPSASAEVIDLTDLLRRSLQSKAAAPAAPRKAVAANDEEEAPPRKRAAATKNGTKARATVKAAPRKR